MLNDTLKAHWPVPKLPDVAHLDDGASGWAFYLCTRKEVRTSRGGSTYVHVVLQDASGTVAGRILDNVERLRDEFDAGEFVRAQARADRHNQRLELVIEAIRRDQPGTGSRATASTRPTTSRRRRVRRTRCGGSCRS